MDQLFAWHDKINREPTQEHDLKHKDIHMWRNNAVSDPMQTYTM